MWAWIVNVWNHLRKGGRPASPRTPRSVPDRVTRLDGSPYGVNSHAAGDDILETLANAGIRWHRVDADWNLIQPERERFEWTEIDRIVAAAQRLNIRLLLSVAYAPRWASRGGDRRSPPDDPDDFASFLRTLVRRHSQHISAISIWNEPNLEDFYIGSQRDYLDKILLPGLHAVRAADLSLVTCGPDLSSSGRPLSSWLAPILDAAGSLLDVITYHQYDGGDTVEGRLREIERVRDFLARRGDSRPLWITEIGWHTGQVFREQQAHHLRQVLTAMRGRPWWRKTFWYDSHGRVRPDRPWEWGLLGPDGTEERGRPRPAFTEYAAVIASATREPSTQA